MKLIGWTLRKKREALKLTQDAIAKEAQITLAAYQEMESAKRKYRIDTFLRVLKVFRLDIMRSLETTSPTTQPRHRVLHEKLDQLLQADHPWPIVAEKNVEAVYNLFESDKRRSVS